MKGLKMTGIPHFSLLIFLLSGSFSLIFSASPRAAQFFGHSNHLLCNAVIPRLRENFWSFLLQPSLYTFHRALFLLPLSVSLRRKDHQRADEEFSHRKPARISFFAPRIPPAPFFLRFFGLSFFFSPSGRFLSLPFRKTFHRKRF